MVSTRDLAGMSDAIYHQQSYRDWKIEEFKAEEIEVKITDAGKRKIKYIGFFAALYKNAEGERAVIFRGTDDGKSWRRDNLQIGLGQIPAQAEMAIKFYEKWNDITSLTVMEFYEKYGIQYSFECDFYNRTSFTQAANMPVAGHSLGGALASIVGNKYFVRTATFNSPGVLGLTTMGSEYSTATSIRRTPGIEEVMHHYGIKTDHVKNLKTKLGTIYIAEAYYEFGLDLTPHDSRQWIQDRYDASGEYDPEIKINKEESSWTKFELPVNGSD